MDNALQLFGSFILTLLGFILPIITILLSLLPDGVKALATKYENEKKQSEDNIIEELKKKEKEKEGAVYSSIEKTVKILKKNKKQAEIKLSFLEPSKVLIRISLPLLISLAGIIIILQHFSSIISLISTFSVMISIFVSGYTLWLSFQILFEVANTINESKRNSEDKIIELLSKLVDNSGKDDLFLKSEKVNIKIGNQTIDETSILSYSSNKQHIIPVSIINTEDRMAKNIEIGFILPKDFLIEKSSNVASMYTDEESQIIRFKEGYIQANTNKQEGNIKITFLKAGKHKINAFIKAENVKNRRFDFYIDVVE